MAEDTTSQVSLTTREQIISDLVRLRHRVSEAQSMAEDLSSALRGAESAGEDPLLSDAEFEIDDIAGSLEQAYDSLDEVVPNSKFPGLAPSSWDKEAAAPPEVDAEA